MEETVTLGSTNIAANKNGFGCLPIQRVDDGTAVKILRRAYDAGINYYDTARGYTDSEHKVGLGLADVRKNIFIATKSYAATPDALKADLETSLAELRTDYIDVYQLHNPETVPKPGDGTGLYEVLEDAKRQGMIRHIGLTNHRMPVAREAAASGLYEVLQYPFSYLADSIDLELVKLCAGQNVGFVAMKSLSGGLISNAKGAYAFLAQYPVLPIWGIQRMSELEEFLACAENPPSLDDPAIRADVERDRAEMVGEFCRGCGYCAPCPVGINVSWAARMEWFVKRGVAQTVFSEEMQSLMAKVPDCIECRQCTPRCPYGLDIPNLIKRHYAYYAKALTEWR